MHCCTQGRQKSAIQENPGQIKEPGTEPECPTCSYLQQRPIRICLLPAGLSPHFSRHNADRLVELGSLPPRTIFYEKSVLLKYFPLDASCVSRSWSCQLELMTVEKSTSKCCCDMAFGSRGAQWWGREGGSMGRDTEKHPGCTKNASGIVGEKLPQPHCFQGGQTLQMQLHLLVGQSPCDIGSLSTCCLLLALSVCQPTKVAHRLPLVRFISILTFPKQKYKAR